MAYADTTASCEVVAYPAPPIALLIDVIAAALTEVIADTAAITLLIEVIVGPTKLVALTVPLT